VVVIREESSLIRIDSLSLEGDFLEKLSSSTTIATVVPTSTLANEETTGASKIGKCKDPCQDVL